MKIDCDLMLLYFLNHSTHEPWHSIFILLYTIVTVTAFTFNLLVLFAVLRRRQRLNNATSNNMKTRNILIGHLCTFDVLLAISMPCTAIDALTKFWPFGINSQIMCKATKSASAVVVFSNSMMIIVIAVDSYRQIVFASGRQLTPSMIIKLTIMIVSLAFLMALPIYYHTRLIQPNEVNNSFDETKATNGSHKSLFTTTAPDSVSVTYLKQTTYKTTSRIHINKNETTREEYFHDVNRMGDDETCDDLEQDWSHVVYCVEDWEFGGQNHDPVNRIYYSLFSLTVQYSIPFITISILYFSIYLKLKKISVIRNNMMDHASDESQRRNNKRDKRINVMLLTISMVFCFCWLPLNLIGTLMDYDYTLFGNETDRMTIIFMSCHIAGMCSACINPVVYGFCNEAIRSGNFIAKLDINIPVILVILRPDAIHFLRSNYSLFLELECLRNKVVDSFKTAFGCLGCIRRRNIIGQEEELELEQQTLPTNRH